ncbi:hypothetical protein NUW54_g1384 [Trametes sanguinea]|uniref:Uncharacterized protein n=1 Tax=Trametes sanguinea TaxID=158606 RepID=A0ACC1Q977_9APHY|nr:hypothetical protein NUW54_g1384 [Trametes sanguinea]
MNRPAYINNKEETHSQPVDSQFKHPDFLLYAYDLATKDRPSHLQASPLIDALLDHAKLASRIAWELKQQGGRVGPQGIKWLHTDMEASFASLLGHLGGSGTDLFDCPAGPGTPYGSLDVHLQESLTEQLRESITAHLEDTLAPRLEASLAEQLERPLEKRLLDSLAQTLAPRVTAELEHAMIGPLMSALRAPLTQALMIPVADTISVEL